MAVAANRLKVRVLEGSTPGGDLDDMVHVQLPRSPTSVTDLAGVAVPEHDVRPRRVPEVVSVEPPPARSRAVRAPMVGQALPALHASAGLPSLRPPARPVREPRGRERNDAAVRPNDHRRGRPGRSHPDRPRPPSFKRVPFHTNDPPIRDAAVRTRAEGLDATYGLSRVPYRRPVTFPLAEWIDGHAGCRHDLAISGMVGTIPSPSPSPAEVRRADEAELRRRLAHDLGVETDRLFLTTGASQANALVLLFLGRQPGGRSPGMCRVCLPEYPPLFDTARAAGFQVTEEEGSAELAVVSQPRNPEGDLWDRSRLLDWASGARSLLVDETFREFAGTRSVLSSERPQVWATGSFTKFYGADDLRVGFLVAPPERASAFARFHGHVTNKLATYSVAGALHALRARESTRRAVGKVLRQNLTAARAAFPRLRALDGPVFFDRIDTGEHSTALARRALAASVLVCPGSYFGDPTGVRICLTRRSFPADLRAYLAVRGSFSPKARGPGRAARRRPGGTARATASPS